MEMKCLFVYLLLINSIALISGYSSSSSSSSKSGRMPLHIGQAVAQINNYATLSKKYQSLISGNLTIDQAIDELFDFNNANNTDFDSKLISEFIKLSQKFFTNTKTLNEMIADSIERKNERAAANVSADCVEQLEQLVLAFRNRSGWAFRVLDAFGKPPSGILNGNIDWYGEFAECRNISVALANTTWQGKYALVTKPIDPMDFFRPYAMHYVRYGICIPDKCTSDDLASLIRFLIYNSTTNHTDAQFNSSWIQIEENHRLLDDFAISTMNIIMTFLIIIAFGTVYDLYKRYKHNIQCREILDETVTDQHSSEKDNIIESEQLYLINLSHDPIFFQLLASFSVYTNTKRIFRTSTNESEMKCLHGIRFLSMAWVVLGHSFAFSLGYSDNIVVVGDYLKRFSFLTISNAFFSVDSFFLLSGLLTSFIFLKELEKHNNNKLTAKFLLRYYLHRLWRLTPPYYMMIIISASLSPYFGSGPLYPPEGFEIDKCRSTWWTNILYINNFVNPKSMCFGISWYLANDMQFHWIAPLILIPFAFDKRYLSTVMCLLFLLANVISSAVILSNNEGIESAQFSPKFTDFFNKFYILPWCRIGPFIIGLFVGYLLILRKRKNYIIKISNLKNVIAWTISIGLCALVVYGLYPDVDETGQPLSRTVHILYQCFSRIVWAIALSYMIYACVTSNGGIVNWFLSWTVWVPLSKLTYSAYLVHTLVILYFNSSQEHPIHIQNSSLVYHYISNLSVSYFLAYFISIFFELPIVGIEKFLFRRQ